MARIHVAVGVVCDKNQRVLIAKRSKDIHLANLWEFPGGKVEPGETGFQGLCRELSEELGIHINNATPLINIPFDYPERSVLLDVWMVTDFSGEPFGKEGQPVRWAERNELATVEFPEANKAIVAALQLPRRLAVSGPSKSVEEYYSHLNKLKNLGADGVLIRSLPQGGGTSLVDVINHVREQGLLPIVHRKCLPASNSVLDSVSILHVDGEFLKGIEVRPDGYQFVGASCHTIDELNKAQAIGCDYAFLSPVMATPSHPQQEPLGWPEFSSLVTQTKIPVYALGGLTRGDFTMAVGMGAQGIACLSDFWFGQ